MKFEAVPMEKSECMICMETELSNTEHISVNAIEGLNRDCQCKYIVHEDCLKKWMTQSPRCPHCNKGIFYETTPEKTISRTTTISKSLHRLFCCLSSPRSRRESSV